MEAFEQEWASRLSEKKAAEEKLVAKVKKEAEEVREVVSLFIYGNDALVLMDIIPFARAWIDIMTNVRINWPIARPRIGKDPNTV